MGLLSVRQEKNYSRWAINTKGKVMKYTKPVTVAQNNAKGNFAAACSFAANDCVGCSRAV